MVLTSLAGCSQEPARNSCSSFTRQSIPEGAAKTAADAAERAQMCVENAAYRLSGAPDGSALVAKVATDSCSLLIVGQANLSKKEGKDMWTANDLMDGYREQALLDVMEIRSARCPAVR